MPSGTTKYFCKYFGIHVQIIIQTVKKYLLLVKGIKYDPNRQVITY